MKDIDPARRDRIEAAAFRKLLAHLRHRSDVQNVDMMGHTGFCRNCLADWLVDAAAEEGAGLDRAAAREHVCGMPAEHWKARFQTPASEEQMRRMDESVAKNRGRGF